MINHIFRDTLDKDMLAFIDDTIMWSQILEGLHDATREVLGRLRDIRLGIAPNKCECAHHQIEFLDYMISG